MFPVFIFKLRDAELLGFVTVYIAWGTSYAFASLQRHSDTTLSGDEINRNGKYFYFKVQSAR